MKIKKQIQRHYTRRQVKNDFLKYWRVVRRYTQIKYDLSEQDLEVLLYLYSEGLFTYYDYKEYTNTMSWDIKRFARLKEDGWIHMWHDKYRGSYRLYELTRHGRHVCTNLYKQLNGEVEIPENSKHNPLVTSKKYSDRVLWMSVKKFNEHVRKNKVSTRIEY